MNPPLPIPATTDARTVAFGIATGGLIVLETSLASEPVGMGISMTEDWKTEAPIVNTCQLPWLYWDTESESLAMSEEAHRSS